MDYNIFSIIVLLLTVCVSLWETLILAWGRRITKSSNTILLFANLSAIVVALNQMLDSAESLIISLFILILIYGLLAYYVGVEYRVHTQKPELVKRLIGVALKEIECSKSENHKKDDKLIFTTDSNKEIQLKEKDAIWNNKKVYSINFKRWINYESKKEIISYIENTIQEEEEYEHSKLKMCFQVLGLLLLTGVMVVLLISDMVMEPKYLREAISDDLPQVVYILNTNKIYEDESVIKELHEEFKDSNGFKNNKISKGKIIELSEVALHYEFNHKILYIGKNDAFIYVDDAVIGNKTWFHRIIWQLHKLFDKTSGTYYRYHTDRIKMSKLIDKMILEY